MQTDKAPNTAARETKPTAFIDFILSQALIMMDDPLILNSEEIEKKDQHEYLETRRMLTTVSSLPRPSCFKTKTCPSDRRNSLPSRLKHHVHFNTEMDSRWSTGVPKFSAPLPPTKRGISK